MKEQPKGLIDYPLPDTAALERQVLVDAVYNNEAIGDLLLLITPDMFTSEVRKKIWATIVRMFNEGEPIDLVSVYAKVGKDATIEMLSNKTDPGTPVSSINHAQLLRDAAARRRAYLSAIKLLEASTMSGNTENNIYSELQVLSNEVHGGIPPSSETPIANVLNIIAEETEERQRLAAQGKKLRVPTGISKLDWFTYQGFGPGNLVVLAARPSVGKTAVMLQMAKASATAGVPTMIFSLEMTKEELGQRMLYSTGLVTPTEVASGNIDWRNYETASGLLSGLPIQINDTSRECSDIISRILLANQQGRCGIAFIDYVGLIVDKANSRVPLYQAIANITGNLKAAAKQAKIPIVALHQLNRESVKEGRAPQLYDLRDSGAIEQDADIVLMLESVENTGNQDLPPDIVMWLRKNRQFKKDVSIKLRPNATYSEFLEVTNEI